MDICIYNLNYSTYLDDRVCTIVSLHGSVECSPTICLKWRV